MSNYHIIPYTTSDGIPTFRDSEIKGLYSRIIYEGLGDTVFHDGSIRTSEQFLALMKSGSNRLWVAYVDSKIVGLAWINRMSTTHCYVHFTFFKEVWGKTVMKDLAHMWFNILFNKLGFQVLMGMTPASYKLCLRFVNKVGFKTLGTVPFMLAQNDDPVGKDGVISYLTREDFNANLQ